MWTLAAEGPYRRYSNCPHPESSGLRPVGCLSFPHSQLPAAQVRGPSPGPRSINSPLHLDRGQAPHVCFSLSPSTCPTAAGLGLPQPSGCCHHRCAPGEEQKAQVLEAQAHSQLSAIQTCSLVTALFVTSWLSATLDLGSVSPET